MNASTLEHIVSLMTRILDILEERGETETELASEVVETRELCRAQMLSKAMTPAPINKTWPCRCGGMITLALLPGQPYGGMVPVGYVCGACHRIYTSAPEELG